MSDFDEKLLKALKEHYQESIFVTDGEGNVIFTNRLAAARLHTTCEEMEGKNVRELIDEGIYRGSTTLEVIRTKQPATGSISDNKKAMTFSNSVPVFGDDGKLAYVITNNMSLEHNQEWESVISRNSEENKRLRREIAYMRLQDKRVFVANSPVMKNVLSTVEAVAPMDSSVVILGESGTGKDMIAEMIHEKSPRKKGAYISINCAAMTESLLESELFGYESGSFTGAHREGKIGLFEAASGGTLFLDEIGEMSLALQSKLLRVLENHEIRRVGGIKNIHVDVRVISATNNNLMEMVEQKTFREDLYYRLSVFTIHLPSLKERKDDIIPIAQLFLDELNQKYGTHKELADVTVETMLNYRWPGNIRELRNVIERIYVISRNNKLVFTPIPTAEYGDEFSVTNGRAGNGGSTGNAGGQANDLRMLDPNQMEFSTLKEFTDYAEQLFIKKTMAECGGSVGKTAERLGIHRSVLYRKLHKK